VRPTLLRTFIGTFWVTAALMLLSGVGLYLGIDMALARVGETAWNDALEGLAGAAPVLCGPIVFLAAMMTVGRFHREGSLLALAAAGLPLRVVGGWLLLASLPFAAVVQLVAVLGGADHELGATDTDSNGGGHLADGGLFVRARTDGVRVGPAAVLPAHEDRLLVGVELPAPAGAPRSQVQLRVFEEWMLGNRPTSVTRVAQPWTWVGQLLTAPHSLVTEEGADAVDLFTLQRWIEEQPWRPDLAFARAGKLRAGLRLLVLILIGCGFWLRAAPDNLLRRNVAAIAAALVYLVVEAAVAAPGAVGALPPDLAGYGPLAAAGLLAARNWWTCDRPRG
jgi:lipopolysaccharide export LptBFGC system permease protein LptF